MRRLIMDLVFIVISKPEYSTPSGSMPAGIWQECSPFSAHKQAHKTLDLG